MEDPASQPKMDILNVGYELKQIGVRLIAVEIQLQFIPRLRIHEARQSLPQNSP